MFNFPILKNSKLWQDIGKNVKKHQQIFASEDIMDFMPSVVGFCENHGFISYISAILSCINISAA